MRDNVSRPVTTVLSLTSFPQFHMRLQGLLDSDGFDRNFYAYLTSNRLRLMDESGSDDMTKGDSVVDALVAHKVEWKNSGKGIALECEVDGNMGHELLDRYGMIFAIAGVVDSPGLPLRKPSHEILVCGTKVFATFGGTNASLPC